jgi:hypothetical protein
VGISVHDWNIGTAHYPIEIAILDNLKGLRQCREAKCLVLDCFEMPSASLYLLIGDCRLNFLLLFNVKPKRALVFLEKLGRFAYNWKPN